MVYRSQQGSDTAENIIALCICCHDLVHAAKLVILAKSGDPNEAPNANEGVRFVEKGK